MKFDTIIEKLKFYAGNNYNALLEGKHGVGKTSIISEVFNHYGWNFDVMNCSTIDSYTDFIGVPEKKHLKLDLNNEESVVSFLETVLPKKFAFDELDALFLDEINRGRNETLNGLLDLIQSKKIKDKYLKRLKVVWAAQNPYTTDTDEEFQYHVNPLDPALKDRFHIFMEIPFDINEGYLKDKYREKSKEIGTDITKPFVKWWRALPEDLKFYCSPRRVDYAIDIFNKGGWLEDVLDKRLNVKNLKNELDNCLVQNFQKELARKIKNSSIEEASKLINIENINLVADMIVKKEINEQYIGAINQDILVHYLSVNQNSPFLIQVENFFKNKNEKIPQYIKEQLFQSENQIIAEFKNNPISNEIAWTAKYMKTISSSIQMAMFKNNKEKGLDVDIGKYIDVFLELNPKIKKMISENLHDIIKFHFECLRKKAISYNNFQQIMTKAGYERIFTGTQYNILDLCVIGLILSKSLKSLAERTKNNKEWVDEAIKDMTKLCFIDKQSFFNKLFDSNNLILAGIINQKKTTELINKKILIELFENSFNYSDFEKNINLMNHLFNDLFAILKEKK